MKKYFWFVYSILAINWTANAMETLNKNPANGQETSAETHPLITHVIIDPLPFEDAELAVNLPGLNLVLCGSRGGTFGLTNPIDPMTETAVYKWGYPLFEDWDNYKKSFQNETRTEEKANGWMDVWDYEI